MQYSPIGQAPFGGTHVMVAIASSAATLAPKNSNETQTADGHVLAKACHENSGRHARSAPILWRCSNVCSEKKYRSHQEHAMPIESINPTTGERFASFAPMRADDLDSILSTADSTQREWARVAFSQRARPMRRTAELLKERSRELARQMALEMGKPLADGVAEVNKCAWVCEHYAENAETMLAPRGERTDAGHSYVRFDPLGVVLAVMPWNFPFWQVFRFIAPHLMAGNGGLLKHASNVPGCALAIEQVMRDAGFPKHLFRTLLINSSEVGWLIQDPRVAAVTLTGSEAAGRSVAEAAGKALKPVVLELGGSDPFIVLADADVATAARVGATSRTINAGQSCICAKRFIVDHSIYDEFVGHFIDAMKKIRMGDPLDPTSQIGPQARQDLRDQLHAQVELSIKQGARLALGGSVPEGKGAFYRPTVLTDVKRGNVAFEEEIFGPVAPIIRASDAEEAVALANASRYGLGASLWTRNAETAAALIPRIESGAVFVNGMVKSDPRLPFGGVKCSGFGRELGVEGIRAFVNVKSVWIQ
jgi:succinate-semialdehyde dehydrogenase / glutarate-semialdehyde dehydrogenase